MSSYIIAGSADSLDTAYCEELARKIKAKYKNIDFRVVIKHSKEWDEYLNQICRIYGFLTKSNPIIYTYHGKIIGNKDAFVNNAIKYFGLQPEDLNISEFSNRVNMKLAEEELNQKNIQRNNIKTLPQKIDITYEKLLKNGTLKHDFKDKQQFLVNGIEFYLREVQGLCSAKKFVDFHKVPIEKEVIEAENIDLMALSLQDQIHPEEGAVKEGQGANNNQAINTESMEKMSEASRTNKIQSSVISRDGDSKHNKESNQEKQQILQEFDDVADYNDHNMEKLCICELGDGFFLSFQKAHNTHIPAQMLIYHNETQNGGNCQRVYNDGRAVIGHRTLIKEIHFIQDDLEAQNSMKQAENEDENAEMANLDNIKPEGQKQEDKKEENQNDEEKKQGQEAQGEGEKKEDKKEGSGQQSKQEQKKKEQQSKIAIQKMEKQKLKMQQVEDITMKAKTEPNIPNAPQIFQTRPQEVISEQDSDLNLVSNLNFHTLYIHKPLSLNELKMIIFTIRETNSIACLQLLPENPNPKIKVYNRNILMESRDSLFPVEKFIHKQIQDGETEKFSLVVDQHRVEESEKIIVEKINGLQFSHLYYSHSKDTNDEGLAKVLKVAIEELLNLEEDLKKEIGYNIIFAKDYTLIVALTEPYKTYGSANLYFDGLAYLGYVHIAKVVEGYNMKQTEKDQSKVVPGMLARCSGYNREE